MKIKYKLILIFILIIVAASLPLSLFILHKQEQEKIKTLTRTGYIFSSILAQSMHDILFINGGDINAAKIDSRDMISILQTLTDDGLVYADAILISSKKDLNGTVLAGFYNPAAWKNPPGNMDRISAEEVEKLKNQSGFMEITIPGINDICYEFSATDSSTGNNPLCIGRVIFSRSIILSPIRNLQQLIFGATLTAIVMASLLGLFFSRFISRPISNLAALAHRIEEGDYNYKLNITTRDELGNLSNTFNHMLQIINMKIMELENTNRRLTELDVLKDEFLANISHELRTPLQGIIGISESLIKGATGGLGADTIHDLSLIITSGRRLSTMVDDILDFSRIKHHDIVLSKKAVSMHDVTQLVISITRPLIEKKALLVSNLIDPGSSFVYGDENRLLQIMLNLISNAIKFTELGEIKITSEQNAGDEKNISFSVIDSGIGIKPDDMERIFESFEQVDGSATRRYGGAGLGLAITKKLVDLHGGKIRAESEFGKGSKFTIILEKCPDQKINITKVTAAQSPGALFEITKDDIRRTPNKKKAAPGEKEKTILVVDDDPINLQVLINHLSLEGYIVIEATNSDEVFSLLAGFLPDLILLDIMLPGISGYDICRKIREKYSSHQLPIMMLTAKNKTDDIVTGLASGANDYLSKPINRDELLARVQSLISLKDSVQLQNELDIIKYELEMALGIQKTILPKDGPMMKYLKFAIRYESTNKIGGDFYNYRVIDDYRIGIFIADVSGHGVPAAIVSAMLEVIFSFFKKEYDNPGILFKNINDKMGDYSHGFYITACYTFVDLEKMKLYHSNAGHRPLLIWRKSEKLLIKDKIFDPPIGMFPGKEYSVNEIDLKNHDRIIYYTDGIIEEKKTARDILGEDRLHELIMNSSDMTADEIADHIMNTVKSESGIKPGDTLSDDATLIIMDIVLPENEQLTKA